MEDTEQKGLEVEEVDLEDQNQAASILSLQPHSSTKEIEIEVFDTIDTNKRPKAFRSTFHEVIVVVILSLAPAASSLANGAYQMSMPETTSHFGISGGSMAWASGSVFLGSGSFVLLLGGLADALGRKNSMMIGYAGYAIFALIGGFMDNFIALCVMRGLQGMSVAAGTPAAAGLLGSTYRSGQRKNRVMACFSAGAPIGNCVGFTVGGICTQLISWRAIHFFMTILYGSLAVAAFFFVPRDRAIDWENSLNILKKMDITGAFLSMAGFTLLAFSLTEGDAADKGWKTPYVIALLIIGVLLIVALGVYESYIPEKPLIPMQIWKSKDFTITMLIVAMGWIEFYGVFTYFGMQYFEKVLGYSPLKTTACFLTMTIVGVAANIVVALTFHLMSGRMFMIIGTLGFLGGAIVWETLDMHRSYWLGPFWAFTLSVIGGDITYNVANMVTLSSVSRELQSSAAGVFNTVIQFAGVIGLAISSAVVGARNPYYGTPEQYDHIPELFDGFKNAYLLAIGCGSVAVFLSCFLKVGKSGAPA
ncbi:unnamed protein product [Kuraishia capsulata CBS 1993]|uniref:Major facilitator superfamily (MFS) profile domain-containing protein n=1 Tax=Kuraishia capsulata CBS 1993 TaxID=1382522 RepID=W6MFU1_9ASCO|nr:uncharacterized protein KUCA_T00000760001 [Kuraishia capsulata CBS 1993]CDK24794.1 unnamed protein product [Kuraishia capsulata CBS 1993]